MKSNNAHRKSLAEELGYSKRDVAVIVNLDDMGVHPGQTDASLEALRAGMARTGSVMVPAPDFGRLAALVRAANAADAMNTANAVNTASAVKGSSLDLGIHLTLTDEWQSKLPWTAVLPREEVPTLYNELGLLPRDEMILAATVKVEDAEREMEAQIKKALDAGLKPTHLDAHMGCYFMRDDLFGAAVALSRKYGIPLTVPVPGYPDSALTRLKEAGYVIADGMTGFYSIPGEENDPGLRRQTYESWVRNLPPGVYHLYVHVAYDTPETRAIMYDLSIRTGDFAVWTDPAFKAFAEGTGVRFIGYSALAALQAKKWGMAL